MNMRFLISIFMLSASEYGNRLLNVLLRSLEGG